MIYGIAAVFASLVITSTPTNVYTAGGGTNYIRGNLAYESCDGERVDVMYQTCYIFDDRKEDDLANKRLVTEDDIDYLIDHYLKLHPNSAFEGNGWAFIQASNKTGLDPIFFFALAGVESAWGTSEIHIAKNNPYSIGMYGDGVHNGYTLSEDSFGEGIVNGALYIYDEYYRKGQKTLYDMNHHGDHCYCNGDSDWEFQIASCMDYCKTLLENR